jgi:hypothetical protein
MNRAIASYVQRFPFEFLEVFARDGDLLAAHLDLSEGKVGHEGQEFSLVPWFQAVDPQGVVWDEGKRDALSRQWRKSIGRCLLPRQVFTIRWDGVVGGQWLSRGP